MPFTLSEAGFMLKCVLGGGERCSVGGDEWQDAECVRDETFQKVPLTGVTLFPVSRSRSWGGGT
jgi:hypothetical protein